MTTFTNFKTFSDTRSKIAVAENTLKEIRAANAAGASPPNAAIFVVYDLPDRDCAAAASNGEYSIANGGVAKYKEYIDALVVLFKEYSDIRLLLLIGKSSCICFWSILSSDYLAQSPTRSPTWSQT